MTEKNINISWRLNIDKFNKIKQNINKNDLNINIISGSESFTYKKFNFINIQLGDGIASAEEIVSFFDLIKYDGWKILNPEDIGVKDEELAIVLFRRMSELANAKIMQRNTLLTRSIIFIKNIFLNAPLHNTKIGLSDFTERFKNKPFLIVSAGPSLDKQLITLKQYAEFFYIIVVDKAYASLEKLQIIPDFVITIDPLSTPSWKQDELGEKTIFINDIGSNPSITWSNNKNHLFVSSNSENSLIAKHFNIDSDILETGGSVATSAFSFAYKCGANPIVFIGQDLAFTDNKDHANDYINAYSEALLESKIKNGFMTDGYYGGVIETDKQLLMYKYWFESKFTTVKDRFIFNCTEGGANIQGAVKIPFLKICEELSSSSDKKIYLVEKKIENSIDQLKLNELILKAEIVVKDFENLRTNCLDIIQLLEKNTVLTKSLELKIDHFLTQIANIDVPLKHLLSNFGQIENYNFNKMVTRTVKKSKKDLLLKYKKFFSNTEKSINDTINFFEETVDIYNILLNNRAGISSDSITYLKNKHM